MIRCSQPLSRSNSSTWRVPPAWPRGAAKWLRTSTRFRSPTTGHHFGRHAVEGCADGECTVIPAVLNAQPLKGILVAGTPQLGGFGAVDLEPSARAPLAVGVAVPAPERLPSNRSARSEPRDRTGRRHSPGRRGARSAATWRLAFREVDDSDGRIGDHDHAPDPARSFVLLHRRRASQPARSPVRAWRSRRARSPRRASGTRGAASGSPGRWRATRNARTTCESRCGRRAARCRCRSRDRARSTARHAGSRQRRCRRAGARRQTRS